jgi:hypothetical protein
MSRTIFSFTRWQLIALTIYSLWPWLWSFAGKSFTTVALLPVIPFGPFMFVLGSLFAWPFAGTDYVGVAYQCGASVSIFFVIYLFVIFRRLIKKWGMRIKK